MSLISIYILSNSAEVASFVIYFCFYSLLSRNCSIEDTAVFLLLNEELFIILNISLFLNFSCLLSELFTPVLTHPSIALTRNKTGFELYAFFFEKFILEMLTSVAFSYSYY